MEHHSIISEGMLHSLSSSLQILHLQCCEKTISIELCFILDIFFYFFFIHLFEFCLIYLRLVGSYVSRLEEPKLNSLQSRLKKCYKICKGVYFPQMDG